MRSKLIAAGLFVLVVTMGTAEAGGDVAAGKQKSATCAGCHGVDGKGKAPNPALAGLEQRYIVHQLEDYKSGARQNPTMKMFASQLSDQDMADVAAYFASLKAK
ncbi:MAG: c-type cytochrome [Acidiferrobacterales bacterium]